MFHRECCGLAVCCALLLLLISTPAHARDEVSTSLYRIFLLDGTTLVSFGEFSRVGDRVVCSIPVDGAWPTPTLQLVTIPDAAVDWPRTDRYSEAVRARRYAETRGEEDFALLSNRVIDALNQLAATPDPARRLAMAEEARGNLARWPAQNHGYRAADVARLTAMLDEVVSELRVAAGESSFDLSLVATTEPPPLVDLLREPDGREATELALVAARLTPEPSERIVLLGSLVNTLKGNREAWASSLLARASAELAAEVRIDKAYAELSRSIVANARASAARGDVKGLQAAIEKALKTDDRLGQRRRGEMSALLASLDRWLEEARQVRLALDAWEVRRELLVAYRKTFDPVVRALSDVRPWLTEIRELAGPAPRLLDRLDQRVVMARRTLDSLRPPAEFQDAKGTLAAALQMARRAASTRKNAVSSNDMRRAWDASSAAAGALMLFDHARAELDRLTAQPPR